MLAHQWLSNLPIVRKIAHRFSKVPNGYMWFQKSSCVLGGMLLAATPAIAAPSSSRIPSLKVSDAQISPCGRHTLFVQGGSVFVDGHRVHRLGEQVRVTTDPVWRRDGSAVAWMERTNIGVRLAVLVDVARPNAPMFWSIPAPASQDHLAWAGPHRVVVGNNILAPRAVASWTEDQN
jgi:hypothetical protein